MSGAAVYCVDTSSLIDGYLDVYPFDVFVRLWSYIEELVQQGRFFAPEEIFDELEDQQDDLFDWAKAHKQMFIQMGRDEDAILRQMVSTFPQLADPIKSKSCASTADQILVAVAAAKGYVVVSEERPGSAQKPKIPELCSYFGVQKIQFLDIVRQEGWTFP